MERSFHFKILLLSKKLLYPPLVYFNTSNVDFEFKCLVVKIKSFRTHHVNPPRHIQLSLL